MKKGSAIDYQIRISFQRSWVFSICIHSRRLHPQYLSEMFVKFESELLSFLLQNQLELRTSEYTSFCQLLVVLAKSKNEVQEWTLGGKSSWSNDIGRLLVAVQSRNLHKIQIFGTFRINLPFLPFSRLCVYHWVPKTKLEECLHHKISQKEAKFYM